MSKKTGLMWQAWYDSAEFAKNYHYDGPLGAFCGKNMQGSKVYLWSPAASSCKIRLFENGNGGAPLSLHDMERTEQGVWQYESKENLDGTYYDFVLVIEGEEIITADPYARACGVNGMRSMFVDLDRTNPSGWKKDKAPKAQAESVIYELHVKEFSWDKNGGFPEDKRGKYLAFTCEDTSYQKDHIHPTGIRYLQELGVTHVQLMPFYDYGSVDEKNSEEAFNWGYDPVNYNVPEGSYSSDPYHGEVRIREAKEMIASLHKAGFRVIMDVVYNHTFSLDSVLQKTMPWYYYRLWEDGTVSNGSGCGNDTASERAMCERYIADSVMYWAKEYHIDGFRFDLMGLLTTKLMNRIQKELDEEFGEGEKLLYGEPWAAGQTAMKEGFTPALKYNMNRLHPSIGFFCDNTRDSIKGSVFLLKSAGFVGGAGYEKEMIKSAAAWNGEEKDPGTPVQSPAQVISYVSAHDNQTLWDKLSETTENESLRRKQYLLAAGIYLTCQGRPFMLSGEEFARTKGGLTDSYNAPIAINRLDWEQTIREQDLVAYYKSLIHFRKNMPGLVDKSDDAWKRITDVWTADHAAAFRVDNRAHGSKEQRAELVKDRNNCPYEELFIIYHASKEPVTIPLPSGDWNLIIQRERFWEAEGEMPRVKDQIVSCDVELLVLAR